MSKIALVFLLSTIGVFGCDQDRVRIHDPIQYLIDVGFITIEGSEQAFHIDKLDTAKAQTILELVRTLHPKTDRAARFYTVWAAMSIPDTVQRNVFVQDYLKKDNRFEDDFLFLEYFATQDKSNQRMQTALYFFAESMDADQTKILLGRMGYLIMEDGVRGNRNGRYKLSSEEIQHLDKALLMVIYHNLYKGFASPQERDIAAGLLETNE